MANIKSSALWSIIALCALASCKSADDEIREKNEQINEVGVKISDLETQCIVLTTDSLKNNPMFNEAKLDSLQAANDTLYNRAVEAYYARLNRTNNLTKFFAPEHIAEIKRTLNKAIKSRKIVPSMERQYEAARRIIAGKGSIYDFQCEINPDIFVRNKDLANEMGIEINPTTGRLIYHILSLQYEVDEAIAKKDITLAMSYAESIDKEVLDAYSAETTNINKQIREIINNPNKKAEVARLNKKLRRTQRNYGVEFADSGLQTKLAKQYIKRNNKDFVNPNIPYAPNFNLPEMQQIRAEWVKNQNTITTQRQLKYDLIKSTEAHFKSEVQDSIDALNKQRQQLIKQRADMVQSKGL